MTRELGATIQGEIDNHAAGYPLRCALMFHGNFDGDPLYAWTGVGELSYNGQTYQGVGALGSISPIIEDAKMSDVRFNVSLSGIPEGSITDIITAVTDGDPNGRDFTIDLAFLNADGQLVGVLPLTAGAMDGAQLIESPTKNELVGTIKLGLTSEASRLSDTTFVRMTNQAQQTLFAGDLGFEFVADTSMREIFWGQKASTTSNSGGGGRYSGKFGGGRSFL